MGLWGNMMLVVGPDKDWINFNFDCPVHLVEEEDGLRIIGKYQHEFLHKVPGKKKKIRDVQCNLKLCFLAVKIYVEYACS